MGGGGPTYQLCPLNKAKRSRVTAQRVPVYACLGSPPWTPPSQDSTPSLLAVRGLPALHPSPGQSGMQPFISRLGCFLTEKKKREMVFSQLHPPSAAAWCGAPTRLSSAGVIGDEPLPRLSDTNRAAQASQVCGSYSGAHPCTLWPTGTLYPDSFADISGFKF